MKIVVHAGSDAPVVHHVRTPGKSWVTRDASLRAMYGDLEARMIAALRYTLAGGTNDRGLQPLRVWIDEAASISPAAWAALRTLDEDKEGHEFHGNQHTGGIPGAGHAKSLKAHHVAHVQSLKLKSAKHAVHALLSSGHPFSKEELAIAVGMDPQGKTINDYLTNLKNPKFAGPKGALDIQKNKDGHFYVALPDGTPAPPPDTKMNLSEPKWKKDDKQLPEEDNEFNHIDPFADMPPADAPGHWGNPPAGHIPTTQAAMAKLIAAAPAVEASFANAPVTPMPHKAEPTATVQQSHLAVMKGAHPGSMPKAEADAHYKDHIDAAYATLKEDLKDGIPTWDALLHFKNQKALGMAAWASAVHGHAFNPTQQSIFKADEQLAIDVQAFGQEAALNNWKHNTAAEKQGNFPPKPKTAPTMPTAKPAAKPAAPVAIADMGNAAPVEPIDYHTIKPKGHVDIDHDDILSRKFTKGILKLKKDLQKDSSDSTANKSTVEHKLRARLADKPNFQALVKRCGFAKEGYGSLESKLIQCWAHSSGDSKPLSVAMQMAVRDAFAMPDSHIEKGALHALDQHAHDIDALTASGIHSLNMNMQKLKPHEIKTARAALQEFVQAQYEETQEYLKSKGHDHVFLVRGMHAPVDHNYEDPAAVKLQPASSFSTNWSTSVGFAGYGGSMFVCKVPRQQVLSTYMTGFGCTGEHEVVVLAHEKVKAWTMPGTQSNSATSAQAYLQKQITAANPGMKAKPPSQKDLDEDEDYY